MTAGSRLGPTLRTSTYSVCPLDPEQLLGCYPSVSWSWPQSPVLGSWSDYCPSPVVRPARDCCQPLSPENCVLGGNSSIPVTSIGLCMCYHSNREFPLPGAVPEGLLISFSFLNATPFQCDLVALSLSPSGRVQPLVRSKWKTHTPVPTASSSVLCPSSGLLRPNPKVSYPY
jgi:hypothetical protein